MTTASNILSPPATIPARLRKAARENALPAPSKFAEAMGLEWVNDAAPGIRRIAHGKTFAYRTAADKPVTDRRILERIATLVIPPAWTDVWICPKASGHIQATGRDARGRKQYIYHPHWRAVRDQTKFDRMLAFGRALPRIRRITAQHIRAAGMPREKVLAAIIQLLEKTLIRIGNDEYARDNNHYGLTTLRNDHAKVRAGTIRFSFSGKSGVAHDVELSDPRLARIVRACQEIPNQELFTYLKEDGKGWVDVTSSDVNAYLKQITGQDFTAKDFRTWAGTVLAVETLEKAGGFDSERQGKKNIVAAIARVAERLRNTKSVCRKCYIHPAVLEAYLGGTLAESLRTSSTGKTIRHLRAQEVAMLCFLEKRLAAAGG